MISTPLMLYTIKNPVRKNFIFLTSYIGWSFNSLIYGCSNWNLLNSLYNLSSLSLLFFKIKGFGFKFSKLNLIKILIIRANITNRILFFCNSNISFMLINKRKVLLLSRNIHFLKASLFRFIFYFKKFKYKKLGVFMKGTIFNLKVSKKKKKF